MLKTKKKKSFQITVIITILFIIAVIAYKDLDKGNELESVDERIDNFCLIIDDVTSNCFIYAVSIYTLLVNPKLFDKKEVQTCGYLSSTIDFIESSSIQYILYPHKDDASQNLFTNALTVKMAEDGTKIFRHMKIPYGIYMCLKGTFSSNADRLMRGSFRNATIVEGIPTRNKYRELNKLNQILDTLQNRETDSFEVIVTTPQQQYCPSFTIEQGKIKPITSPAPSACP
ncbi:MAG: hypothetical protein LBR60_04070 [Fibrobacter sp.]|jgi:hypothetical protein|nr:hypothetical protein [Fibrobacter sp.]